MVGGPEIKRKETERLEGMAPDRVAAPRTNAERKANGIHYTPPLLAGYLADQVVFALLRSLPAKGKIRVLDPACGDGELLKAIVDAVPAGAKGRLTLTGFDTDPEAVRRAQGVLSKCAVSLVEISCIDFLSIVKGSGDGAQMDLGLGNRNPDRQRVELGFDAVIS